MKFCKVIDCKRKSKVKEMCSKHYKRWIRTGTVERICRRKSDICKECGKEFYNPSVKNPKFCGRKCYYKSIRKGTEKRCVICSSIFLVGRWQKFMSKRTTCSNECRGKLLSKTSRKRRTKYLKIVCKNCKKEFEQSRCFSWRKFCNPKCFHEYSKIYRKGANNPNYRSGYYSNGNFKGFTAWKHTQACQKYRKNFLEEHDYLFCEICNKSNSWKYEVHHIYFASRFPKHKGLHDFKNLILVCRDCHLKFHNGKELQNVFEILEIKRGLQELFMKAK